QFTADGTQQFATNRWIPVEEGQQWRVEGLVRRTDTGAGSGGVTVGVSIEDADGAPGGLGLWEVATISRAAMPVGAWTPRVGDGTVPAGGVRMQFVWWVESGYTSGTVQGTGFGLRRKAGGVLIEDDGITAPKIKTGEVIARHLE